MSKRTDSSFLDIDPLKLDEEWLAQPKLYFVWAEKAADTRQEVDNAKTAIDIAKAQTDSRIRRNPTKYGLKESPTESSISAKVLLDDAVQEAVQAYSDARHNADVAQAAVTAIEHRKRALTMLVDLHQSGYYAEPKERSGSKSSNSMDKADVLQRSLAKKTALKRALREEGEED